MKKIKKSVLNKKQNYKIKNNNFKFSNKNDEKIFTIFLVVFAFLSFALFLYQEYSFIKDSLLPNETILNAFNQKNILKKKEAIEIAKNHIQYNNIIDIKLLEKFDVSINYFKSGREISFLEHVLGKEKAMEYISKYDIPLNYYGVRFFKEYEIEEITVYIDDYSKRVIGFSYYIPKNKTELLNNLTKDEAKIKALDYLKNENFNLTNLEEKDYSTEKIQKRIDHHFTYKITDSVINSEYGEAYLELKIDILGNKIGGYRYFLLIPEDFTKNTNKELELGNFLSLISLFATLIIFLIAFTISIINIIKKKTKWKFFLTISIISFIFLFIEKINSIPAIKYNYPTNLPFEAYLGNFILISVVLIFLSCLIIFTTGTAGFALTNEIWPKKIKDLIDISEKKIFTKRISYSILRGYLIAMLIFGITVITYIIGERFLGIWSLNLEEISTSNLVYIPFFTIFVISLIEAAILEEFTYRLFGISFFKKYLGSTFLAVLIPTLIWAIAHSNYPVFPIYFRAIELIIIGIIMSYFFLRYNITTVITTHYILDAVYLGIGLIFSGSLFLILGEIFILSLPLIIAIIGLIKK
ncbi:MAG: CPBP family glutamic-type intramembrane protease [Candidatus Pacearchaeota archaeon]